MVLKAVDELREDAIISNATWAKLAGHFSLEQRIDIIATVGNYTLVSFMLNSFGVELEDWIERYDSAYGRFNQ